MNQDQLRQVAKSDLFARQLSWTFDPGNAYKSFGKLNSRYSLTLLNHETHRIKVSWTTDRVCVAYVWRPGQMDWSEVATLKVAETEYPPREWKDLCYGNGLGVTHPYFREMREKKGMNQKGVRLHNAFAFEVLDRDRARVAELEVLKRAAWALFGVDRVPEILDDVMPTGPESRQVQDYWDKEDKNFYP